MQPKVEALRRSIDVTLDNAKSLLEDARTLFSWDRYGTALALAVLAQEEFAKAFLLQLVADGALPWHRGVQRSIAQHECKHILALIMEWLPPWDTVLAPGRRSKALVFHEAWMAWHKRKLDRLGKLELEDDPNDPEPLDPALEFPPEIAKALNILRHEQIERLRGGYAWRDPDWSQGRARKIADGALDRRKQSALYVDITPTGDVGMHPGQISSAEAAEAIKSAERLQDTPLGYSDEYDEIRKILPLLFAELSDPPTSSS